MKKLNSYSRHIYQHMGRSPKQTKQNLTKEESLFNKLLRDWLYDTQVAGIALDQEMINAQCGLFKMQAQRMALALREDNEDTDEGVDWGAIAEALEDLNFQWSSNIIESTRTVRVKVTGMVTSSRMNKQTTEVLRTALSGDFFEEYETVSFTVCSVERVNPVQEKHIPETERYCEAMVRDHVLSMYLSEVGEPEESMIKKLKGPLPMNKAAKWWAHFRLMNL